MQVVTPVAPITPVPRLAVRRSIRDVEMEEYEMQYEMEDADRAPRDRHKQALMPPPPAPAPAPAPSPTGAGAGAHVSGMRPSVPASPLWPPQSAPQYGATAGGTAADGALPLDLDERDRANREEEYYDEDAAGEEEEA